MYFIQSKGCQAVGSVNGRETPDHSPSFALYLPGESTTPCLCSFTILCDCNRGFWSPRIMITLLRPNTVRWSLLVLRCSPVNTTLALQSFKPNKYHLEDTIHNLQTAYEYEYHEVR